MTLFQNKYRAETHRLAGYDYGYSGMYFVTMCTQDRAHYFGEIVDGKFIPSKIGQIAIDYWTDIPNHYPFVDFEAFVVMPDHMHGILLFDRPDKIDWTPNKFGPQSKNLGAVVRAFKCTVKRYANQNEIPFQWQRNYHDRIIRNFNEFERISRYIENNPRKWQEKMDRKTNFL